ncbi:MAG TPA: DUF748 domain-containing protein [Candidatus Binataceae bacterium]|nr:DUF748 domain-containing protein [Candidatus Binataceae bacterium]
MSDLRKWGEIGVERASALGNRAIGIARTRRARRIGIGAAIFIVLLGVVTYFAVPMVLHGLLVGQIAKQLKRPVSVGRIGFNLYTLRLDVDQLHIGEPAGAESFVDVGHLRVRVSWTSIFRFAPVIKEVSITKPSVHIVRVAEQRFNFSDLLESPNPPPPPKEKPAAKPMRFAVSNIRLTDGDVRFEDQVLATQHKIEHIQLGIPFIANLPADVDIYVQPLLEMLVDGSPLRIAGLAKPFANPPESVVALKLHKLDLQRYLGYAPKRIAIKIPSGTLSSDLQLHFVNATGPGAHPRIAVNGAVALDQLAVHDAADAPLVELRHAEVKLTDVEPLENVIALGKIWVDGLVTHVTLNADGTNNLASAMGATPAPSASPTVAAPAVPLTQTAEAPAEKSAMDVSLASFAMANSTVKLTDNRNPMPNAVSLENIHIGLQNFHLNGQTPAPFDVGAKLASGGTIAVKGAVNLAQSQATSEVTIDQIDLPGVQGFAQPTFMGNIASGKFNAHANLIAHFAHGPFNIHVEPANVSIDDLKVDDPKRETPIQWKTFAVALAQFDLAAHHAVINEVHADGINLFVRRGRRGEISLASLIRSSTPATKKIPRAKVATPPPAAESPKSAPWTYKVSSIALENTSARVIDDSTPRRADLTVAPLNIHMKDVSEDFAKPIALEVAGTLNNNGSFQISGTAAPVPLKADLKISTDHLNLAPVDPYAASKLNATITSAALTMKGALGLDSAHKDFRVSYKGDAMLGDVMVLDKVTGDPFVQWRKLNVTRINMKSGAGPLYAHIGAIGLDDFYARVILRKDGTLNLKDVVASEKAPPTSLTRTEQPPGAAPAPAPSEPAVAPASNADIEVGKIALKDGHLNYSDNFIQPNYSADLTEIAGKIGKFGTGTTEPAPVQLDGEVNGSSPIDISGAMNPLAPKASLDITAKADGIELTGLTPYSNTYAGYPIVKGTLTVNVHYILKDAQLTAENHILLDQLTFGEPLPGAKTSKIPLRLAIALLKDSSGKIDLNIPVSGSLSDPKFSVTDVILGALKTIIIKAATAPFNLLASVIPGFHGGEQLGYVEFAPGFATLTPEARKSLETFASALQQRPSLRLSIEGRVDPALDHDGLREAKLLEQMKAEKMKDKGLSGDPDSIELTPSEYEKYLSRVYKAAKFTKPTNFLGLDKSLPPDEMKKLLLPHIDVTDADLHHLADARAAAVRKWMSEKVDPGRLFLEAPKLTAEGISDKGKTTRVDLSFE